MSFSSPPSSLLASATLRRAIGSLTSKMSSAYRAAARTQFFDNSLVITSWFRGKVQNEAAGGEEFSQHRFALAFDMSGTFDDLLTIVTEAQRVGLVAFVNDDQDTAHFQALTAGTIPREVFVVLERVLGEL